MLYTYKIATINVKGIASTTRMGMLGDFLMSQDINITLLREVAHDNFATISYTAFTNEGTEKRGTAILAKEGIKHLPSGWGIAAMFMGVWIMNIYAQSDAEKRLEREMFFNRGIAFLLPTNPSDILLAGDFNCVVSLAECAGQRNVSRALLTLLKGLGLHDVGNAYRQNCIYTLY
jgi:exonuclease III